MNSLDQAFLKAYARQTQGGVHSPEPPVTEKLSDDGLETRSTGIHQRRDSGHHGAGPWAGQPHAPFSATIDLPREEPAPSTGPAIDSVFLPPEQPDETQEFSPGWEVDRFTWPELCGRLIDLQRRYFRHVGEQLSAASTKSHHVVLVSGTRRGEGRTTLALCLAHSVSAAGVDVAVVDADWQNPQLGNRLGVETPCSWTEVLEGKRTLSEAAVTAVEERVTLFPLKPSSHRPDSIGVGRPSEMVRRISNHFPLVIIDAGPLDGQATPPFVCGKDGFVDAAIIVRDLRYTSHQEALASARCLQRSGIAAVGIAENFASERG
jgi:Mrp family chromosome partitioning ATPase